MFQRCILPLSLGIWISRMQKVCWIYRHRVVHAKLGQNNGERDDDQARKRTNGRRVVGHSTREKEWDRIEISLFQGPRGVTGWDRPNKGQFLSWWQLGQLTPVAGGFYVMRSVRPAMTITQQYSHHRNWERSKAVPLHAMEALGAEDV
jgi:hypothetical protein